MNLPNKITVTRLVLAPFFFAAFFLSDLFPNINPVLYAVIIGLLYFVMELTDLLDGMAARRNNLVTDLGKVIDPFADVMCHLTFFTCLLYAGIMPVWAFILIMWREFAQSFTRMLMMGKGKALAANIFGKAKTCLYAVTCILGFVLRFCMVAAIDFEFISAFRTVLTALFGLAAFASVASYLIYVKGIIDSKVLNGMTR